MSLIGIDHSKKTKFLFTYLKFWGSNSGPCASRTKNKFLMDHSKNYLSCYWWLILVILVTQEERSGGSQFEASQGK
jgi:hypothetical protein